MPVTLGWIVAGALAQRHTHHVTAHSPLRAIARCGGCTSCLQSTLTLDEPKKGFEGRHWLLRKPTAAKQLPHVFVVQTVTVPPR